MTRQSVFSVRGPVNSRVKLIKFMLLRMPSSFPVLAFTLHVKKEREKERNKKMTTKNDNKKVEVDEDDAMTPIKMQTNVYLGKRWRGHSTIPTSCGNE